MSPDDGMLHDEQPQRNGSPASLKLTEHLFLQPQQFALLCRRLQLSVRESEILAGILLDLKDQAIACELGISIHTVRTHLVRLFRKLNVKTRAGLLARTFQTYYSMTNGDAPADRKSA